MMAQTYAKIVQNRIIDHLDIFLESDLAGVTTPGKATVRLPVRQAGAGER